ncbi:MAG TPA: transposase domain-containing protein, partial [Longimicrobium sp.]
MARTRKPRQEEDRLSDLMNIGVLTTRFPLEQIHEVLKETGRASERVRDLPAHVMMYYVIALGLFR